MKLAEPYVPEPGEKVVVVLKDKQSLHVLWAEQTNDLLWGVYVCGSYETLSREIVERIEPCLPGLKQLTIEQRVSALEQKHNPPVKPPCPTCGNQRYALTVQHAGGVRFVGYRCCACGAMASYEPNLFAHTTGMSSRGIT